MPKKSRLAQILTIGILAFLIPLIYAIYTQQIWEDFLITLRFSENFAQGKGMVYFGAEKIYGFTSALEMFILSFCSFISGKASYLTIIWLYRIISAAVLSLGCILLFLSFSEENKKINFKGLALNLLCLTEVKTIAFSANGMETAFLFFFFSWFIFLTASGKLKNYLYLGICFAGFIWTRPDGCIYIAALSLSLLLFNPLPHKDTLKILLKAIALSALLYSPWLILSWLYYGNPIPHTILAKKHLLIFPANLEEFITKLGMVFEGTLGPIYYQSEYSSWPGWIRFFTRITGFFAFIYWLMPTKDKIGKIASLTYFLLCLYMVPIRKFPWYFPPLALLTLTAIVSGYFRKNNLINALIFLSIFSCLAFIFTISSYQMRIQQKEIEMNVRRQAGLWLKDNVRGNETVYSESLGYVGYFSQAKMLDYPGLVSAEVRKFLENNKEADFYTTANNLKPDWMVLRRHEAVKLSLLSEYFRLHYRQMASFDATRNLENYQNMPGIEVLLGDAQFLIFKKI
ncbi:MAG: hypothetical protein MUC39_03835 [Candidatus Omnitrophica bacterium]|nr:hypothetical protein [Candidatus Omnitrophota bacterium]